MQTNSEVLEPASATNPQILSALARRFGVDSLYNFQERAINSFLAHRDSFIIVPTGGGKSFCYIMPSAVSNGLVLVISPLISLMREQAQIVRNHGIACASYDSTLDADARRVVESDLALNRIRILFVSPERLALQGFRDLLANLKLSLIVIDEAHCVLHWGEGFRPEYKKLGDYLATLNSAPRMALSATVPAQEREEIVHALGMEDPEYIIAAAPRQNLKLSIHKHSSVELQNKSVKQAALAQDKKGIIYGPTRRIVEDLFKDLKCILRDKVGIYHAGLDIESRMQQQEDFRTSKTEILVATKAFGMGLNLPDISFVLHAGLPCSVESYAQEIGRAGRDGRIAHCELHYGPRDFFIHKFMIEKSYPSEESILKIYDYFKFGYPSEDRYSTGPDQEIIGIRTGLDFSEVNLALEFIAREFFYDMGSEISVSSLAALSEVWNSIKVEDLLEIRRHRIEKKMSKLRCMRDLFKSTSSVQDYLETYFN